MSVRNPMAKWTLLLATLAASNCLTATAFAAKPATYRLQADPKVGQATHVIASLEVGGDLKIQGENKVDLMPMSVSANLEYDEHLLAVPQDDQYHFRSLRHYSKIDAAIRVDKGGETPELREDRRLIVVDRQGDQTVIFSPEGHLTRDELDLVDILGNTLVIDELLPSRSVAVGEKWTHGKLTIGSLLGLDAIAKSDVQSELLGMHGHVARLEMSGLVHGAIEGVATEIELKAKYHFDTKLKRITALVLAVKENRSIGHVGPGVDVVAKLKLAITPIKPSPGLQAAIKEKLTVEPTTELTRLEHVAPDGTFRFACDRRWYLTTDDRNMVVLRLIDRGNLVAQCNISPALRRSPEKPMSLEQYQQDVKHTLGKRAEQIVSAAEYSDAAGQLVYRVVARGEVEKLPIEWRYYLIAAPNGRRTALSFTVEGELAERLGTSDRELVSTVVLLEPELAEGEPTPAESPVASEQAAKPSGRATK